MDKRLHSNVKSRKGKTAFKNSYGPQLLRPGLRSNGRGRYVRVLEIYIFFVLMVLSWVLRNQHQIEEIQWTNQNSKLIHAAGTLRGKKCTWGSCIVLAFYGPCLFVTQLFCLFFFFHFLFLLNQSLRDKMQYQSDYELVSSKNCAC